MTYKTGEFTNDRAVPDRRRSPIPRWQAGVKAVVDPGIDGKKMRRDANGEAQRSRSVRTDTFTSNYTPKVEIIHIGTKGASSKAATSTPTPKKP